MARATLMTQNNRDVGLTSRPPSNVAISVKVFAALVPALTVGVVAAMTRRKNSPSVSRITAVVRAWLKMRVALGSANFASSLLMIVNATAFVGFMVPAPSVNSVTLLTPASTVE